MPTENDLRVLLRGLEAGAPDVDEVLTGLQLARGGDRGWARRRTTLVIGAAAAVVVAIAAAALLGLAREPVRGPVGAPKTAPPTRAELRPAWRFTVAPVRGYTIVRDTIIRVAPLPWQQQGAAVTATTGRVSGRIVVHIDSPGGWPASLAGLRTSTGQDVEVDGQPAYFTPPSPLTVTTPDPWQAAADDPQSQPQLVWQLPGGAWAMLAGTFGYQPAHRIYDAVAARRQMSRIAAAVRYRAPAPVTLPFRVTTAPAGLVPSTLRDFDTDAYCLGLAAPDDVEQTDKGADVLVCRTVAAPRPAGRFGHLLAADATLATRRLADGSVLRVIDIPGPHRLGAAAARAVLRHVDVSPRPADPSTWLRLGP